MNPFTPYDEARSKSTTTALCALLDLFNLPGEDSVLEWELRKVLYACSEPERQIILDAAKQASAAIGRYLSVRQVAAMFATRPRDIRRLARSGGCRPSSGMGGCSLHETIGLHPRTAL